MADFEQWDLIPAQLRDACKWTGVILMQGRRLATHFNCREWKANEGGVLRIAGALVDTSERHQGITLRPRWTYLEEGYYGGQMAWFIRPIRLEEN